MKIIFYIIRYSPIFPYLYLLYFVTLKDHTNLTENDLYQVIFSTTIIAVILCIINITIILYAVFQYLYKGTYNEWLLRKKIKNKAHAGFLAFFSITALIVLLIAVAPSTRNKLKERIEQSKNHSKQLSESLRTNQGHALELIRETN